MNKYEQRHESYDRKVHKSTKINLGTLQSKSNDTQRQHKAKVDRNLRTLLYRLNILLSQSVSIGLTYQCEICFKALKITNTLIKI